MEWWNIKSSDFKMGFICGEIFGIFLVTVSLVLGYVL